MARPGQKKFVLWLPVETLERWKSEIGDRKVSGFVREAVEQRLQDRAGNVRVEFSGSSGVVVNSGSTSSSTVVVEHPLTPYDRSCSNKLYHWKGPCRFCGGGQ